MAATQPAKRGLTALVKRGWDEIPDILAGTALALVGLGLGLVGIVNYYKNDGENRRYKMSYLVLRPDDPRAAKVHKD